MAQETKYDRQANEAAFERAKAAGRASITKPRPVVRGGTIKETMRLPSQSAARSEFRPAGVKAYNEGLARIRSENPSAPTSAHAASLASLFGWPVADAEKFIRQQTR